MPKFGVILLFILAVPVLCLALVLGLLALVGALALGIVSLPLLALVLCIRGSQRAETAVGITPAVRSSETADHS